MRRMWTSYLLLAGLLFLTHTRVFAQDGSIDASTLRAQQLEQEAKLAREAQARSQKALSDFIRSSRMPAGTSNGLNSLFYDFRMAIPKFRAATDDYRWALSMQSKLDKSLKEMGAQTNVMLKYLDSRKVSHPKVDPQEFKDYSPAELQWETLNSAERIAAYLDFAVMAERQETVTAKTLEFLYRLDGELLRLKWLTGRVK